MQSWLFQSLAGRTTVGYLLMFLVPLTNSTLFVKLVGFHGLRHMFSYEYKETVIHRLDPRIKIIYPVTIGILSVMLTWDAVFVLFAVTLIPWAILKPSRDKLRVLITMAGVPVIGMIWAQGLFHVGHGRILFAFPATIRWFGTPGVSTAGLLYGAENAGRMLVSVSASLILLMTTKPSDIVWAFYKFKMPASFGFAFTVALRFLPQMIERLTLLLKAMEVRGYDLSRPRLWEIQKWPSYLRRLCASIPTVTVPLLIGSLRGTSVMAMVADARAFAAVPQRTVLKEHQVTRTDGVAWAALATLVVVVVVCISLHVGARQSYA